VARGETTGFGRPDKPLISPRVRKFEIGFWARLFGLHCVFGFGFGFVFCFCFSFCFSFFSSLSLTLFFLCLRSSDKIFIFLFQVFLIFFFFHFCISITNDVSVRHKTGSYHEIRLCLVCVLWKQRRGVRQIVRTTNWCAR